MMLRIAWRHGLAKTSFQVAAWSCEPAHGLTRRNPISTNVSGDIRSAVVRASARPAFPVPSPKPPVPTTSATSERARDGHQTQQRSGRWLSTARLASPTPRGSSGATLSSRQNSTRASTHSSS